MNLGELKQYSLLMRLDKPIGIFLVLWPTLWALWLAGAGMPNLVVVSVYIIGCILMRSAGCVINDIADRKFDGFVARTRDRPLAAARVSVRSAFYLLLGLLLCAFLLVLLLNKLTIALAFVGVLLAVIYPFLKRITHLPQVGLGIAFSWGVPMAFASVTGSVSAQGWLVFFAALWWPIMYDTLYAMVDRADDLKIGVKSTAILFGKADRWIVGVLQVFFLLLLCLVGKVFQLNIFYYLSLAGAGVLFIYQQVLIKDGLPENCFKAFLNNHWVGCIIFLGIVLSYANCSG